MLAWPAKLGAATAALCTALSAILLFVIVTVLLGNSWTATQQLGWQMFSLSWHPASGEFGMVPMLFGTLAVTAIALLSAVPLGLLAAVYTSEMLSPRFRLPVKSMLEILAGIPSIIYGLIGVAFLSLWIADLFSLASGRTILAGGLLLGIMILPTVISLSDDALHNVPQKYREAARGLGLYEYEVISSAVLPLAKRGIVGAVLLAVGRVMGETMAVMLVIGSIDRIPDPFFDFLAPGQTITSKLGRELAESAFGSLHFSALITMGLLLLVAVLMLTAFVQIFLVSERRLHE